MLEFLEIEKDCFRLHLVGACFQSSSLLCQICRFGECSWCCHNVLEYTIWAAECHQQRIGADMSGWIGSVKEVVCAAQTELGQAPTLVAPHNQAWTVWSYCRLWKQTETCLTRMTWTSWGPDHKHQNVVQNVVTSLDTFACSLLSQLISLAAFPPQNFSRFSVIMLEYAH